MKTRRITQALLATLLLLTLAPANIPGTQAQTDSRLFPETGKTARGPFLRYWNEHGGLSRQGLPISDEMLERSETDGKTYIVQYFERARLELHPDMAGTPFEVMSGLLGVWQYGALYGRAGAPNQRPNTSINSALFSETGRRVGGPFLQHWERNGGLAQFGYPISDEFTEISAFDDKPYTVQYFERAVMELHPEEPNPANRVMLSQLGRYRHALLYVSPQLPPAENNRAQVNLVASDLFLAWRELETGETLPDPHYRPLYNLRGMDLRTGRVFPIASTYNEFSKPAISGSLLAWASENLQCSTCDMDVYARDLATGEMMLVATGAAIQYAPAVSGKRVAWLERNGSRRLLLMRDLEAPGSQAVIGEDERQFGSVNQIAADSQRFVWVNGTAGIFDSEYMVRSWEGQDSPVQTVLDRTPYSGLFPRIALSGNKVVVAANVISIIKIETGQVQPIGRYWDEIHYVSATKGIAVWVERSRSLDTTTLWAYPTEGATTQPVSLDSGTIRDPAISGERLLYIKDGRLVSRQLAELLGGAGH